MNDKNIATPIKTGIVGLGRAGWNIHAKRLRSDARFQISAVTDLESARLEQARDELSCQTYPDAATLLQEADCELVVIASQSVDHAAQSIQSLESGRHVVVEKPMATNLAEADRMIAAAQGAGKKLWVHQNYRYQADFRHLLEVIQSGILGEVFQIRMRGLGFARRNDWQTLRKYGGGTLNNTGPHFVDMALLLLDSPVEKMFSSLQLTSDAGDAEDHVKLLLQGRNGRVADIEISTSCAFPEPKWTLLSTRGTLVCDGKTSEIKWFDAADVTPLEVIEGAVAGRKYGNDEKLPWREEERPATTGATDDFYDNVYAVLREGASQHITPESVREVIRLIEQAHRDNEPLHRYNGNRSLS